MRVKDITMRIALVIGLVLITVQCLFAGIVEDCEDAYRKGDIARLQALVKQTAEQANEKACAGYFGALLAGEDQKGKLLALNESYPHTHYGKMALLEIAKLAFFERDYTSAEAALAGLAQSDLIEKDYWLAKTYERLEKNNLAISSAQVYISHSQDPVMVESSWFTIATAQLNKGDFSSALRTLESMRNSTKVNNIPLLWLKIGECHEKLGDYAQAINAYRKIMSDYRYTQYCYTAEDRLHQLDDRNQGDVDVTQFSTFDSTGKKNEETPKQESIPDNVLKFYLQVGAFSTEENADRYRREMIASGYPAISFSKVAAGKELFVVAAGPYRTRDEAMDAKQKLAGEKVNSLLIQRY